ncbi:MAG: UDP-4-amino-4,6-dideoxy-N-acetyl-beta-L-altrosamine transaminase [Lachnospiraceae bacterium]|nr:UDP-4-amino-4,6-dideoxy-N-acetyl-beta-L-altrosamine transaminase [Lachnospiraceae bacterium]
MEQLAIFGGTPIRKEPLFYGRQDIDDADIDAVVNVLRSDYLTCGPKITELEEKLCKITGAKYAVAVSNGTAALHIAAMAAGIGEGDEVITSPITFAASANCTLYCGGRPVFADIDPETYNIDPADMERKITPATKAVVAVDFTGQAVAHKEIEALCKKHNLIFIEDAAHAIGTKYDGKPVGSLADMTCFSFHPVKTVTSGEGGAVTTNDENLYKKLVLYRSHGITRDMAQMRNPSDNPWYNEQVTLGYNYRLTDIQAALLISQLDKLPAFSKRRSELVDFYNKAFSDLPEIIIQKEIPQSDTTRHLYILQLDPEKVTCSRREFFDAMAAEGIHCQVHYLPVYRHSYYEKELGYPKGLCPNAETLYERILSIPLFYKLSGQDAQDVSDAVHKIINYYRK